MKTVKYDVLSLDVWGNEQDGFDVNDRSCFQRGVEFPTTEEKYYSHMTGNSVEYWPSDQQIIDTLIEIGFLNPDVKLSDIDIDGDPQYSLYLDDSSNGFPICQLEFVKD